MLKRKLVDSYGTNQRPAKAVRFTDPTPSPAVTVAPSLQADPNPISLKRKREEYRETEERPPKSRLVNEPMQSFSRLLIPASSLVGSEAGQPAETPSDTSLSADSLNTAIDEPPSSTTPPPKKQRKSAKQRRAARKRLQPEPPPQPPKPRPDQSAFKNVPNEIMDHILEQMDAVDKACFALTSKQNYQLVQEATHKIPKELCPRNIVGFACQMTIKGKGNYRALLRRLALWLPTDDMLHCLRAPRVAPKSELLKRDRIWKKKFFRDWSYVRMGIVRSLRKLDGDVRRRKTAKERGLGLRSSLRAKTVRGRGRQDIGLADGEEEWGRLIRESKRRAGEGMVLRPKAVVEMG